MIFSGLRATPGQPPGSAPMIPWSWISITATTHVLHAHLAASTASSCCVIWWVIHMFWTVICPSFTSCQVKPLTCTSCCALLNSHLRAGCQCLRCRIPRQPQFSSAYPPNEFSCVAWTVHHQANVRQQSALPISTTVGMAASILRPWFGQPAEVCIPCTFDTVTGCMWCDMCFF
jgi:hypothetical protein